MLVVLLPKLWFWIENHDWHNCFWMSSLGSLLLGPKKLQNQQFYIIDWIWKKLLVDVANLSTCCHDDYDVLLEVLGTVRKCYVSNPVAKTLVLDWKSWLAQLFLDVFLGLTLTGPKKASKSTILRKKLPCAHRRTLTQHFPLELTWCFTRAKLAPKCPCHTMCSQRQVSWISAPKPKH